MVLVILPVVLMVLVVVLVAVLVVLAVVLVVPVVEAAAGAEVVGPLTEAMSRRWSASRRGNSTSRTVLPRS